MYNYSFHIANTCSHSGCTTRHSTFPIWVCIANVQRVTSHSPYTFTHRMRNSSSHIPNINSRIGSVMPHSTMHICDSTLRVYNLSFHITNMSSRFEMYNFTFHITNMCSRSACTNAQSRRDECRPHSAMSLPHCTTAKWFCHLKCTCCIANLNATLSHSLHHVHCEFAVREMGFTS